MPDFAMEAKAVLESIGTVDYADWDYQRFSPISKNTDISSESFGKHR